MPRTDPTLRHKSTARSHYDAARARAGVGEDGVFDVLMHNAEGELTECSIANVAVETEAGGWRTPPVACGLLPGVMREALLARGALCEGVVTLAELHGALHAGRRLIAFNSVRGQFLLRLDARSVSLLQQATAAVAADGDGGASAAEGGGGGVEAAAGPWRALQAACPHPTASDCAYQACYCEENVYRLVASQLSGRDVRVAFLSNKSRTFPIWCMRNACEPGDLVVWDYHVLAIERRAGCDPACRRLQPCVVEAAAPRGRGCSPAW